MKEVWEVEKPLDRVIHTMGWPLQLRRQVPRVRRLVHLPDGRGQDLDGPRGRARLPRRALLGARRAPGAQGPPARGQDHRGRQARGLGRQDDPVRRLLGDAARSSGRPGMAICGDGAGMVNVPDAEGRPLRDARRHVRRRGDLRAAQGRRLERRPVELRGEGRGLGDRDGHLPLAQHAPAVREGLPRRRRDREHDGDLRRALPGRALGDARRRHGGRVRRQGARLPEARRQDRRSTSCRRSSPPATPPATTRRTTSASRRRCRSRWR